VEKIFGESRQLATYSFKEKFTQKIIKQRTNLIVQVAASPVILFSPLIIQKVEYVNLK